MSACAWHDRVGDLTLFEALTGGAFDRQNGNIAGNLTKIFQKSQMPRGLPGGGGDGRFWNWPVHYGVHSAVLWARVPPEVEGVAWELGLRLSLPQLFSFFENKHGGCNWCSSWIHLCVLSHLQGRKWFIYILYIETCCYSFFFLFV